MIRIILVACMLLAPLSAVACLCPCMTPHNTENSVDDQKDDTKDMIEEKEDDIKDALDEYADALDEKIAKMKTLLKTMRHTEALMKANQIKRRKILKLWDNTTQASATKMPGTGKSKERRNIP